jgi:hypothetical protein
MRHLKAYDNIKGTELKKIITTITKQYHKIDKPTFQTRLHSRMLVGPTGHNYYKWLLEMIRRTLNTRQDLVSRNLWPKIEVAEDVEITTMAVHQVICNGWNHNKSFTSKWGSYGTSPRSKRIPNLITALSDTTVSYDITKTSHILTTTNYKKQPKPTDNIWIGISPVHLPTYWCPLCEIWEIHPESPHTDRMVFLKRTREEKQQFITRDPTQRYTRGKD